MVELIWNKWTVPFIHTHLKSEKADRQQCVTHPLVTLSKFLLLQLLK